MTRVVFVDDEEDLVWSSTRQIRRDRPDLEVEGFTNPQQAIARIRVAPPDVLVTDLRMPEMTGLELILASRDIQPMLPAVLVTAFGSPAVQSEVRERGTIEYLEKPFTQTTLLEAVDRALSKTRGFSGSVSLLALPDLLQIFSFEQFTGAVILSHARESGTIWFAEGEVCHAEKGDLAGTEAVYSMLSWSGGRFRVRHGETPPSRTIRSRIQELLLECFRVFDEAGSGEGHNEEPEPEEPLATAQEIERYQVALQRLGDLDGFIGACLADSNSGQVLAELSRGSFDITRIASEKAKAIRSEWRAVERLGGGEAIEDLVLNMKHHYHLVRPVASRDHLFLFLVLDKEMANLALGRLTLASEENRLTLAYPKAPTVAARGR